jgi:hypothetical protein
MLTARYCAARAAVASTKRCQRNKVIANSIPSDVTRGHRLRDRLTTTARDAFSEDASPVSARALIFGRRRQGIGLRLYFPSF